ncbi:SGNH/GDSL hydrolase family protein [Anaeromicropila herbilytica]|uniref:SGNH hydrolase-type esterase domain-containing protein n=1 Tax=Anaeromicropila herbilytica TaxID=2785025 RepID=A0A7R7ELG0_9FIRM|nr:hypothetical protein [Anaeromicropila herbilytica]BCN30662.1 hypothetical protein bsdtb5_19570 [Anaeromicropila herbilytica]
MRKMKFKKRSIFIIISILLLSSIFGTSTDISAKTSSKKTVYGGKLIIVGDSRTRNMCKWVKTNDIETRFVSKPGKGYDWFISEGAAEATSIAESGDTILVWLGVNDYDMFSLYSKYKKAPWELYTEAINKLAKTDWAKCKVCVAGVGYVDRGRIINYYGKDNRSNISSITNRLPINGIKGFNTYLKTKLDSNITWINTTSVIGIKASDNSTSSNLWLKRSNGLYDGLHYNKKTTQKIYDYFAKTVLELNAR